MAIVPISVVVSTAIIVGHAGRDDRFKRRRGCRLLHGLPA